jgi:hypothetical protein
LSDVVEFRTYAQAVITDIQNVKATVGCIETRGRWGIIDRSTGLANVVFDNRDAAMDLDDAEEVMSNDGNPEDISD